MSSQELCEIKKHCFEIEIPSSPVQAPCSISLYLCNVMTASVVLLSICTATSSKCGFLHPWNGRQKPDGSFGPKKPISRMPLSFSSSKALTAQRPAGI